MSMPGFTAEASFFTTGGYYQRTLNEAGGPGIMPQLHLSRERELLRDIPLGSGARLPSSPTFCSWNLFCCLEYRDQSCCQRWRLRCVPE